MRLYCSKCINLNENKIEFIMVNRLNENAKNTGSKHPKV